jgi:hypothetical protein
MFSIVDMENHQSLGDDPLDYEGRELAETVSIVSVQFEIGRRNLVAALSKATIEARILGLKMQNAADKFAHMQ